MNNELHNAHVNEYRDVLAGSFYDFYKEVHGCSPRWMPLDEMSIEELNYELEQLSKVAEVYAEHERMMDAVEGKLHHSECGWEPEPAPVNNPFKGLKDLVS